MQVRLRIKQGRPNQWNLASDLIHTFWSVILKQYSFSCFDSFVIYQLPCPSYLPIGQSGFTYLYPIIPELSTKQIVHSEGSTFKSVILKQ